MSKIFEISFFQKNNKLISLLLLIIINSCTSESTDEVVITPAVIQKFTLIVNSSEGGSVSTVGGEYTKGSTVTVTATPNPGYSFAGWTGNSSSSESSISIVIQGNISITANFTQDVIPTYTLSVSSSEGGSVDIEQGEYEKGAIVEINASVDENYQFVNWTDSNGTVLGEELLILVTVNEDTQIQANFSLIPENITFSNPLITPGILSGEFTIDYEISGDFSGIVSKGVTLNDSIYADDISENKINLTIESLEYQEYQVKFFVETSLGQYFSESFTLTPDFECASVELVDSDMMLEQEFCTYENISNIKLAYTGTNILVEYEEDLIPSGISISNENGIVEISGTPYSSDSDNFTFDIKFVSLGECEDIIKTVVLNRSPNSPKINYISGSLSQTITAGGQIEPIEFQYAGSAEGFSFSDLPDGLSYSITGTTYKIQGSLNTAGSYSSTITTVNQSGCAELSESFSFEVNQPVSSGGGGGSSESNESEESTAEPQKTYIPDDEFEQVLIDYGYDDVLDDYVLTSNISGITCFSSNEEKALFQGKGISDMTGIQDFTSLKWLSLYNNPITSIDLSSLNNLGHLDLGETNISSVDLSSNSQLTNVYLYNNTNLTSVNVTGLSNLRILNLSGTGNISSINVSSSDKLTQISGLNSISCITVSQSQIDNQIDGGVVPADYTTNSLGQRTYNFSDSCGTLNAPAIDWGNNSHKSKFNLSCN